MEIAKPENKKDTRLSYSSAKLLLGCEQKYWHHKIGKTPNDPDYSDDVESLNLGKAFHEVLEHTLHGQQYPTDLFSLVRKSCEENNILGEWPLVAAMCDKYFTLHHASGLECFKTEFSLSHEKFVGYIDAIMLDKKNNGWWISDNKTSARFDPSILSRLAKDPQLNLYSYFATNMNLGDILGIKGKFLGARYRISVKTVTKQKDKEPDEKFVVRLTDVVKAFDIKIPIAAMNPVGAWDRQMELWDRSEELRQGVAPRKNLDFCENYHRCCQFWSQCYEKTATECKNLIEIYDEDTFNRENQLGDLI